MYFPRTLYFCFSLYFQNKERVLPTLMMKKIWIFPVQCIVACHVILRIKNGNPPPRQHQATGFAQTTQCAFCPVQTDFFWMLFRQISVLKG